MSIEESNQPGASQSAPTGSTTSGTARRAILVGAGLGAVGVVAAACSSNATSRTTPGGGSNASGAVLANVAEIPVGGAKLAQGGGTTWLLAQPEAGKVVCHSGICTHAGCPLTEISGSEGICRCHGSTFDANSGEVLRGPAAQPLAEQQIEVVKGSVRLG